MKVQLEIDRMVEFPVAVGVSDAAFVERAIRLRGVVHGVGAALFSASVNVVHDRFQQGRVCDRPSKQASGVGIGRPAVGIACAFGRAVRVAMAGFMLSPTA